MNAIGVVLRIALVVLAFFYAISVVVIWIVDKKSTLVGVIYRNVRYDILWIWALLKRVF
jgi:hypothetical protein